MLQLNRANYAGAVACSQSKSTQPSRNLAAGWGNSCQGNIWTTSEWAEPRATFVYWWSYVSITIWWHPVIFTTVLWITVHIIFFLLPSILQDSSPVSNQPLSSTSIHYPQFLPLSPSVCLPILPLILHFLEPNLLVLFLFHMYSFVLLTHSLPSSLFFMLP